MAASNTIIKQCRPLCFILLLITYSCLCYVVDTRHSNCLNSGLNILKEKDVKRIKATFDLKSVSIILFYLMYNWVLVALLLYSLSRNNMCIDKYLTIKLPLKTVILVK